MKLVSTAEMHEIEEKAAAGGFSYDQMMKNAGRGLAEIIHFFDFHDSERQIIGLVGSGKNGGDTLIALTLLVQTGWKVMAYLVSPRPEDDLLIKELSEEGGKFIAASEDKSYETLDFWLGESTVMLDGVFGTGLKLPIMPDAERTLTHVSSFLPLPFVIAVDCPSGIDCESGEVSPAVIPADMTVCMAAIKKGLMKFPAYEYVGEIEVVDIGLPDELGAWKDVKHEVVGLERVQSILPTRKMNAHKGTFGTVMVVAGSMNYTGAAYLASKAAYRIGAGLVQTAIPGSLYAPLAGHLTEATWLILPEEMGVIAVGAVDLVRKNLDKATALLLGPGWGMEPTTLEFLKKLITDKSVAKRIGIGFVGGASNAHDARTVHLPPLVIDADGLKLLAQITDWPSCLPEQSVLTPHPGEMAVLTGLTVEEIQNNRLNITLKYAREWGHVVVLKGALTVIASPDGRAGVIPVASSALARAGTGDILAGTITGLRAQGVAAYEAALAGAWIHAQAGLAAASLVGHEAAVLAGDVLEAIADVLREIGE